MLIQIALNIITLCFVHAHQQRFNGNIGQPNTCFTPFRELGSCVSLKNCPQVVNLFTILPRNQATQYSSQLQRICGHQTTPDNYPVVCCTQVVVRNEPITQKPELQFLTERPTPTPRTITVDKTTPEYGQTLENSGTVLDVRRDSCRGPNSVEGYCIQLQQCPVLFKLLEKDPNDDDTKVMLRESHKICQSMEYGVCCPSDVNKRGSLLEQGNRLPNNVASGKIPTEDEGCGITQQSLTKIIGGVDSQIGAWPWIVLVGYNIRSLAPFKCGGTLISGQHVITAAHCIRRDLIFVRLGEFDLSTDTETQHVDINVSKVKSHPDFGKDGRNDLAILFLENNVEFTDLISPICLPSSPSLRTKSYIRSHPFVAGWGRTEEGGGNSNVLQQLQIPIQENSVCRNSHRANNRLFSENQFDDSVICAGDLAGGRDSCQGDSGGPLMIAEPYKGKTRFYLIGVVSYGIKCAQIGIPGVYTRIQHFIDWIENKIAEE